MLRASCASHWRAVLSYHSVPITFSKDASPLPSNTNTFMFPDMYLHHLHLLVLNCTMWHFRSSIDIVVTDILFALHPTVLMPLLASSANNFFHIAVCQVIPNYCKKCNTHTPLNIFDIITYTLFIHIMEDIHLVFFLTSLPEKFCSFQ